MRLLRQTSGQPLEIGTTPLDGGGPQPLFAVQGSERICARLLSPESMSPEAARRMTWMRDHPPLLPRYSEEHQPLIWPLDLLLHPETAELAGMLLPVTGGLAPLGALAQLSSRLALFPTFTYRDVLRVCRNLAESVRLLELASIVPVGLADTSVLVSGGGLITLSDPELWRMDDGVAAGEFESAGAILERLLTPLITCGVIPLPGLAMAARLPDGRAPLPAEWQAAIEELGRSLRRCPARGEHLYPPQLPTCPWCAEILAGHPDPYPASAQEDHPARTPARSQRGLLARLLGRAS